MPEHASISLGFSIPYQPDMLAWKWGGDGYYVRALMLALAARLDANDCALDLARQVIGGKRTKALIAKCKRAEAEMVKRCRDDIHICISNEHGFIGSDLSLTGHGKVAYARPNDDASMLTVFCHADDLEMRP
jgi:hypothetical protein